MYTLRPSGIDSDFFEIQKDGVVVDEIVIRFRLPKTIPVFSSKEEVLSWVQELERKQANGWVEQLLARRSYSKKKLFYFLQRKGISEEVANIAIDRAENLGWISDADFGGALERKLARQGYGPLYIENKRREYGLEKKKTIDRALYQEAFAKAKEKCKNKPRPKQIAALLRRGFPLDLIHDLEKHHED